MTYWLDWSDSELRLEDSVHLLTHSTEENRIESSVVQEE